MRWWDAYLANEDFQYNLLVKNFAKPIADALGLKKWRMRRLNDLGRPEWILTVGITQVGFFDFQNDMVFKFQWAGEEYFAETADEMVKKLKQSKERMEDG